MATGIRSTAWALLGVLLALAACGSDEQALVPPAGSAEEAGVARIEGEVFYRERIMIPPDSTVEVQLEDISRADAPATVVESVAFRAGGGPPYAFSIEYDPASIDTRMRYALRARITSPADDLLFTNTEYIDPFGGNPVSVMVQGVARPDPGKSSPDATPDEPTGGSIVWLLVTLGGKEAPVGAGGKAVELQLNAADGTVAGFSGCNRYTGGFSSKGSSPHGTPIKFGPMAGTLMACADGEELERAYLQMLGQVDAYRMHGKQLELLSGGKVLATFRQR